MDNVYPAEAWAELARELIAHDAAVYGTGRRLTVLLREMTCFACDATSRNVRDVCQTCDWHKCPACDACLCKMSPEGKRIALAVFETSLRTMEPLVDALLYIVEDSVDDESAIKFQGIAGFALQRAGRGL